MNNAVFLVQNKTIVVSAKDIASRKEYLEKYAGKLHCPTPGCCAQLDYVELPYSMNKKIFRTHKGSAHIASCPYDIIHLPSNAPSFSSETFSQNISEEHVKSILKGLYQRNINPLHSATRAAKRSPTKHHKHVTPPTPVARHAVASLDPNAEPVAKGKREPVVRKRRCQDLLAEDNNRLRGVDGTVDSAYIGEDYIELHFASTGYPVTLFFYNAFRDNNEQSYNLVKHLAHLLTTTDLRVLVCCLGVVEMDNNKATIQIMSPNHITIEGLSIFNYMSVLAS